MSDGITPEAAPMREDVTKILAMLENARLEMIERDVNGWPNAILFAQEWIVAHTARLDAGEVRSAHHALIQAGMHESTNTAIDLIPYDVAVRALRDQALSRHDSKDDYVLPCDVHLPPAIVIRAGCPLSTLKLAMEWEGRPRHFEGNPRYSVSTDAGDEVERWCRVLAKADGIDWDAICPYESKSAEEIGDIACESGTCVAAHYEDHEPDVARSRYRRLASAVSALAAMREGGDREAVDASGNLTAPVARVKYDELERDFAAIRKDYGHAAWLIEQMRERWKVVSDQLDHIEGGMFATYCPFCGVLYGATTAAEGVPS